jgi:hypothetical protein
MSPHQACLRLPNRFSIAPAADFPPRSLRRIGRGQSFVPGIPPDDIARLAEATDRHVEIVGV